MRRLVLALALGTAACSSDVAENSFENSIETSETSTVADLIHEAEVFAETCAKYGPDDPNDDSCAHQKIVEVKLRNDHRMCLDEASDHYRFVPCVNDGAGASDSFTVSESNRERCEENPASSACLATNSKGESEAYSVAEGHQEAVVELRRLDELCANDGGGVSGSPNCLAAERIEKTLAAEGFCADYHNNYALRKCKPN